MCCWTERTATPGFHFHSSHAKGNTLFHKWVHRKRKYLSKNGISKSVIKDLLYRSWCSLVGGLICLYIRQTHIPAIDPVSSFPGIFLSIKQFGLKYITKFEHRILVTIGKFTFNLQLWSQFPKEIVELQESVIIFQRLLALPYHAINCFRIIAALFFYISFLLFFFYYGHSGPAVINAANGLWSFRIM